MATDRQRKKREAFKRLAEKRVTRVINDIRLVGNLANRSTYDFTDSDISKIFRALEGELRQAKSRFGTASEPREPIFTLDD